MKRIIGLYAGSFDPFHRGHLNIFNKSESIFGKGNVVIAIGINPEKNTENSTELRSEEISKVIGCNVLTYCGFLHEFIEFIEKEQDVSVVLIRGLRNGNDLDYEVNQSRYMQDFKPDIKIIYITCDKEYEHISSSAIRSLEKISPGSSKKYSI